MKNSKTRKRRAKSKGAKSKRGEGLKKSQFSLTEKLMIVLLAFAGFGLTVAIQYIKAL